MGSLECDVADCVPFGTLPDLLQDTRLKLGVEGVVVRWPSTGHMVKLKTSWWLALSASQKKGGGEPARALLDALQAVPLSSIPAQTVWHAILEGDDDQMALVYGCLTPEAQGALRGFAKLMQQGIATLSQELQEWAERLPREASEADLTRIAGGWPLGILSAYQRRSETAERLLR